MTSKNWLDFGGDIMLSTAAFAEVCTLRVLILGSDNYFKADTPDMDMGQLFETQPNPTCLAEVQHVVHQPNPTHFHISVVETILFVILSIFWNLKR